MFDIVNTAKVGHKIVYKHILFFIAFCTNNSTNNGVGLQVLPTLVTALLLESDYITTSMADKLQFVSLFFKHDKKIIIINK